MVFKSFRHINILTRNRNKNINSKYLAENTHAAFGTSHDMYASLLTQKCQKYENRPQKSAYTSKYQLQNDF